MKLKMTSNTMSKYLIAQLQYVKQSWVKGGGERYKRKQAARWYKNLCWSKNSEKSLIGEIRREFRLVMSVGQRKNSESPWEIEPQTIGFRASMLYHWATETLRWMRSITKLIWQASCILLGSAKSWIICKCNISITEFYLDHFYRESHLIFDKNLPSNLIKQLHLTYFLE